MRRLKMRKSACLQARSVNNAFAIAWPKTPAYIRRCDAGICLFEDYIDSRLFSVTPDEMKVCPLINNSPQTD